MLTANEIRRADREVCRQIADHVKEARPKMRGFISSVLVNSDGKPLATVVELTRMAAIELRKYARFHGPLAALIREDGCIVLGAACDGVEFVRRIPQAARRLRRELRRPLYPSDVALLTNEASDLCVGGRRKGH